MDQEKKIWIKELIKDELDFSEISFFLNTTNPMQHRFFSPSPFQAAAFITLDGVGEWSTSGFGIGKDNQIDLQADIQFPHSIGLLYSAFTYYTDFV